MEIRETSDYEMFKLHSANRTIDEKYVIKMAERMRKKFLLRSFPIVTDVNMYIMDGQTRYCAAKLLKKPIYYVIDPDIVIEDVATLNHNKSWSLMDYVKSYAMLGNETYQEILERMRKEYDNLEFGLSTILLFSTTNYVSYAENTRNGTIKINSRDEYDIQTQRAIDIYRAIDCSPTEYVSRAMVAVIRNEQYDHETMMHKLHNVMQKERFMPLFSTIGNIKQLENMYNHRTKKEQRVSFG